MTEPTPEMAAATAVLGTVSTLLDTIDWDHLASEVGRAEALGPVLLPTEFAASLATGNLARNRAAIDATRTYLAALRRIHQQEIHAE